MVRLRTHYWPATVINQEEVEDTSPSAMAMRWVSVNVFGKGERVVKACEINPYPPKASQHKMPKEWKAAMEMAAAASSSE